MPRLITVAAAQLGPIARNETRSLVVKRLLALLAEAHGRGADLVVFPELALTTFFPRWWMDDQAEIDAFFALHTGHFIRPRPEKERFAADGDPQLAICLAPKRESAIEEWARSRARMTRGGVRAAQCFEPW